MNITRRSALRGGTATMAAIAAGGAVAARVAVADPVIALVEEINRVQKAWYGAIESHDLAQSRNHPGLAALAKEVETNKVRYWQLREEICETPAGTIQGVLAKLRGFYDDYEIEIMLSGREVDPLDEDFAASVFRDIVRLAGRAES